MRALHAVVPLVLALAGCGASNTPEPASPSAAKAAPSAAKADPGLAAPAKVDRLQRSALQKVLPSGLPWLLRRVWPEDVFQDGKFVGWRLVAIPEEWSGVDLRPDDVITKVNGKSIETPEQLWDAWAALATAPELRVAYDRNGEARELVLPIEGPPAPELFAALTSASPPARKAPAKRGTVVIESRDPGGDPGEDP